MKNSQRKKKVKTRPRAPRQSQKKDVWDEICEQFGEAPDAREDEEWQRVVKQLESQDTQELLEGQQFQGQGQ